MELGIYPSIEKVDCFCGGLAEVDVEKKILAPKVARTSRYIPVFSIETCNCFHGSFCVYFILAWCFHLLRSTGR